MARRPYRISVERVDGLAEVPLPRKATPGAACLDLHAAAPAILRQGEVVRVRTGLRMRAPSGTFLEVRPRSGLSSRGVIMVNAPGTIDADFAGEVEVPLTFLFPGEFRVEAGDRIGQVRVVEEHPSEAVLAPVPRVPGRTGGFGSTGR